MIDWIGEIDVILVYIQMFLCFDLQYKPNQING